MAPIKAPAAPNSANRIGLGRRVRIPVGKRMPAGGRVSPVAEGEGACAGAPGLKASAAGRDPEDDPGTRIPCAGVDVGGAAGAACTPDAGIDKACPHFGHATVCPAALSGTLRCWLHLGQAKIGIRLDSRGATVHYNSALVDA